MTKKTETVSLTITYDDEAYLSPRRWDWNALCDLPDPVIVNEEES